MASLPIKRSRLRPTFHRDGTISFYAFGDDWRRSKAADIGSAELEDFTPAQRERIRAMMRQARIVEVSEEPEPHWTETMGGDFL